MNDEKFNKGEGERRRFVSKKQSNNGGGKMKFKELKRTEAEQRLFEKNKLKMEN